MTTKYIRTEILNFFELPEITQEVKRKDMDYLEEEQLSEEMFVPCPTHRGDYLPLSMFMKTEKNNFTHGVYSTSAFDGYFITLSKDGSTAVVAHKYF